MGVKIELDSKAIAELTQAMKRAAQSTIHQLDEHLKNNAMTMPFDGGNMQNGGTYVRVLKDGTTKQGATVKGNEVVDLSEGDTIHIALTNDAPQARRLYYHPEYNFQQTGNPDAGAYWLAPYLEGGEKEDFVKDTYSAILKKEAGLE